jgi:hypothetical protein
LPDINIGDLCGLLQVHTYDFVHYDDHIYVYENPNIQAGSYGLISDINGDCYVDLLDLGIIASYWLHTDCGVPNNNCGGTDFIPTDGTVNFVDFSDFAVDWMRCNNPQDSNCTPN